MPDLPWPEYIYQNGLVHKNTLSQPMVPIPDGKGTNFAFREYCFNIIMFLDYVQHTVQAGKVVFVL